ncbi:MAG: ATP-binding protein [Cyanobacteriota bacterium]|nr:ATP-binding protein [Cyanobacteriota bacterium]
MIDVQVAAMAVQREDLYPDVDPQIRSNLSTIVLELGTNIIKYAGHGKILLRLLVSREETAIEILATDEGPGIANAEQALQDHFTTGKSLGLGLGVVKRLANTFELGRSEQGGTRVRAVCQWSKAGQQQSVSSQAKQPAGVQQKTGHARSGQNPTNLQQLTQQDSQQLMLENHVHIRAALHQQVSGDAVVVIDQGSLGIRIVLDGAGHGPTAHELSARAAQAIEQHLNDKLEALEPAAESDIQWSQSGIDGFMVETMNVTHERIRGSRGVAFGMAVFDCCHRRLHFLGIGNTRILLLGLKGWEGVSRDGQLGVSFKRPVINHFQLNPGDVVLQSSDGIRTSTLRAMRPTRRDNTINMPQITKELLKRTTLDDDVSILMTRCHV